MCIRDRSTWAHKFHIADIKMKRKTRSDSKSSQSLISEDCKEEAKNKAAKKNSSKVAQASNNKQDKSPSATGAKRSFPEPEAANCAICYKEIEVQGAIESCKHMYCFSCISRWSKVGSSLSLDSKHVSGVQASFSRH
eukprot:TRINITY_DN1553_c0_g2_i1.p1 TRINITY_DN1553_c0_g2~~TRINITY_DN1553_c0_g2_i1.p1  ORF type:complete len:137 (+),score=18.29 TRINITY_DN1553_c0_g2_i1:73-483(+)